MNTQPPTQPKRSPKKNLTARGSSNFKLASPERSKTGYNVPTKKRDLSEGVKSPRPLEHLQINGVSKGKSIKKASSFGIENNSVLLKGASKIAKKVVGKSLIEVGSPRGNFEEVKSPRDQGSQKVELPAIKSLTVVKEKLKLQVSQQPKQNMSKKNSIKLDQDEDEIKKIHIYYRYKLGTLTKLIEDKVRNLGITSKIGQGKRQPISVNSLGQVKTQSNEDAAENPLLYEEVWKHLKKFASTKSKYKYRDTINYEKKVISAIKTLISDGPLKASTATQNALNLELDDEHSKKDQKNNDTLKMKRSKSPDLKIKLSNGFNQQKKENPFAKIFIVDNVYPDIKKALIKRGWIENPDTASKNFTLKWALKKTDIDYESLSDNQCVNHFGKNTSITTKVELARNIRNLIWYANDDTDNFYPRCYDLNDGQEFEDFLEEFKFGKAIAILRLITSLKKVSGADDTEINLWKFRLCVALEICERRLKPIDIAVEDILRGKSLMARQEEWEIMTLKDINTILKGKKYMTLRKWLGSRYNVQFVDPIQKEEEGLLAKASGMLTRIEVSLPQSRMNQGSNVWIIKPAGLSRGRGIRCYDDLGEILDHVRVKESEWVAQKYIENPLIIRNRKFDIRQWVLVTDWNPLTVWFFDECYIRFTAQDFNPNDYTNKFAHLTNNSISKKLEIQVCNTEEIEGNMWTLQQFRDYLTETFGKDEFELKIQALMKQIVIKSLKSVQDMVESRKNSFELFGYDFMIDEDCNPWLIEINSSPTMEYSTTVTERLVKMVAEDCMKVIVDYGQGKQKDKKKIDTGSFKCIYPQKFP